MAHKEPQILTRPGKTCQQQKGRAAWISATGTTTADPRRPLRIVQVKGSENFHGPEKHRNAKGPGCALESVLFLKAWAPTDFLLDF